MDIRVFNEKIEGDLVNILSVQDLLRSSRCSPESARFEGQWKVVSLHYFKFFDYRNWILCVFCFPTASPIIPYITILRSCVWLNEISALPPIYPFSQIPLLDNEVINGIEINMHACTQVNTGAHAHVPSPAYISLFLGYWFPIMCAPSGPDSTHKIWQTAFLISQNLNSSS